ncbi:hypothetical protein [Nocardioides ochotonae]|uniref:hypothetical protein n=1 Tax=Nocardioides ochotonae TaxID=2685869 RepID=UPI00140E67C2|nr:hypothetical protein [Nocardioides ochotonae]
MSPLSDRLRRATTLVLVVAALVLGPQLALATFGSSTAAPALSVGTATMVAPTAVTGTYVCELGFFEEFLRVDVTGFTDDGPSGAQYVYTIVQNGRSRITTTSSNRRVSLQGKIDLHAGPTTWEVTITSKLGNWTSPTSYRRSITCPWFNAGETASGNL